MAKYKCVNWGECDKAMSGEIVDRSPGEDLKCPACGMLLVEPKPTAKPAAGNKTPLIAAGIAVLALLAGGGYFFKKSASTAAEPAAAQAVAVAPVAPGTATGSPGVAPAQSKTTETGLAPSSAETKELRMSGDAKLSQGDAEGAELASNKAAANEMLKTAIAKMAQGKFDEAEKDLNEARARSPKQSLVYYNMAILRLRQGRTDDALRELEASFMAGFTFFDKMDLDSDFDGLRKDSRFVNLLAKYRTPAK